MVKLLFLLIFSFTHSVYSQPNDIYFHCENYMGVPVLVVPTNSLDLLQRNVVFAVADVTATYYPIIYLDVENLKKTPKQFQLFVKQHECSHHRLGHIGAYSSPPSHNAQKTQQEKMADCMAIQFLIKSKQFIKEDVKILINFVKNEDKIISTIVKKFKYKPRILQSYDIRTPKQRSDDIMKCANFVLKE